MKAIIVGGGKVGFYLAKVLLEQGYTITIIEQDKEQCRFCANSLDAEIICGDGTDDDILKLCDINNTDTIIAVMGQDENNLVCCQIAKNIFGIKYSNIVPVHDATPEYLPCATWILPIVPQCFFGTALLATAKYEVILISLI